MPNHTISKNIPYTVDYLLDLLTKAKLLSPDQIQQVRAQHASVRTRIMRERVARDGTKKAARTRVGPAEIIAEFRFLTPTGASLDQDAIARLVAADAGLAFEKPDPIEIDMKLVATTVSQP